MSQKVPFTHLNLNTALWNALDDLGLEYATTIQHKVFNVAMSGRDVCGIAQTGTGKTIAYLLPCIKQWAFNKEKDPQTLILVPTRELVVQVVNTINSLTQHMSFKAIGVYGGVTLSNQKNELKEGVDFIVATPGRFFDLVQHGAFRVKTIKKVVVDEVDEMLALGFRTQLKNIFELLPEKRQNLFFSATLSEEVETFIEDNFNNPVKIEAAPVGTPLENIAQTIYEVPNFYTKINLLKHLLADKETYNKVLVFAPSKKLADIVYTSLEKDFPEEYNVIHSNKEQKHRFNSVNSFNDGSYRFLIATDIVARGIDVAEVSHVINMDVPSEAENYIHRIGRTGRATKDGIAITFCTPKEVEYKTAIETLMNYTIPMVQMPETIEISEQLIYEEMPVVQLDFPRAPLKKDPNAGASFHTKSAKNSKTNKKVTRKEQMQIKYGKPIKKGPKKK
jgi:ATP-dependent RNA helicase RhlE